MMNWIVALVLQKKKFTQRSKVYSYEYEDHVRTGILAKLLDKDLYERICQE